MTWSGIAMSRDFENQILDLENEISNRQLSALEAQIFYDHLTLIYEKVSTFESQVKKIDCYRDSDHICECFNIIRLVYLRAIELKIKLTKILSSAESTPLSIKTMIIDRSSPAKQSATSQPEVSTSLKESQVGADHTKTAKDGLASVVGFSTKLKISESEQTKPSEPDTTLQSIELKLSNLETLYSDLLQSYLTKCDKLADNGGYDGSDGYDEYNRNETEKSTDDILFSLDDNLEVSKDIQYRMGFLEKTLKKFVDNTERREKNILDKLNELLETKKSQKKDCKCRKCDPISGLVQPCTRISAPMINAMADLWNPFFPSSHSTVPPLNRNNFNS